MPRYRRARTGPTYFFTLVSFERRPILCYAPIRNVLRDSAIWQRRFYEHQIVDERDFQNHVDYVHFNPVRHGHADSVAAWPFSTFHRYVPAGILPADWGGTAEARQMRLE